MSTSRNIRVILVDDHARVHQLVTTALSKSEDITLIAQGATGEEAIQLAEKYQPDLMLMDVVMPVMSGVEATKVIHERFPNVKIMVLSSFQDDESVHAMLQNGATGYILKNAISSDLVNMIRTAHTGVAVFSSEVAQVLIHVNKGVVNNFGLTEREIEVLKLMAMGLNNAEIAQKLVISQSTVKFHINNLIQKMGVETRAEAIVIAAKNNLI
jgi:two-component system, NarL family, response regulator LiaR